ncbi:MAG: universal stress protein [Anaerolineales bacterium]
MNAQAYQPQPIKRVTTKPHHKYLNILIADDGSPDILAAIDLLTSLPLTNCSVTAISVITAREGDSYAIRQACLEQTSTLFQKKGIPVTTRLEGGDPAEKILEHARLMQPALVVMGANGLRHVFGVPLGGVVEKVVEEIRQPVLIMRHPFHGLQRIGLFTDGSSQAEYATQYLAELPLPDDVVVHVVHVEPPPDYNSIVAQSWQEQGAGAATVVKQRSAEEIIQKSLLILQDHEINTKSALLTGEPCDQISRYMEQEQLNLAVVGARGFSKGKSWELGSLPRKLLHYCPCPTLIVKDRRDWSTRN